MPNTNSQYRVVGPKQDSNQVSIRSDDGCVAVIWNGPEAPGKDTMDDAHFFALAISVHRELADALRESIKSYIWRTHSPQMAEAVINGCPLPEDCVWPSFIVDGLAALAKAKG